MSSTVIKRNGSVVDFDIKKIEQAIEKSRAETMEFESEEVYELSKKVKLMIDNASVKNSAVEVEIIQDKVEEVLIAENLPKTAKAYILYRSERAKERERDLFKKRVNLKPYEYPELAEYVDSIRHSYWVHTEFNYTSDIQDFKKNVSSAERNAIKNAMLAVSQVEVSVKTFWGNLYNKLPKPEIANVGATFSESEARHSDAYSHLLEILGLNDEFEKITDIPSLMKRVRYLDVSNLTTSDRDNRDYALAVLLFSLFIEHVSLFSQFLIIMSFNKYRNIFKGISNVIEATSKEEQIHGLFGIDLINLIKEENPQWFDKDMEEEVVKACLEALEAESEVLDWIYEDGDLDFMPKEIVLEFIKNRLNNSLDSIGYDRIFEVDDELLKETDWFDDEIVATKHNDFFAKRSVNYTKRSKSITGDDLF